MGQHRLGKELLVLIKSQLEWVFGGRITLSPHAKSRLCIVITNEQLGQFWQLEDVSYREIALYPCEDQFLEMVRRNSSGRYIVHIPFTKCMHELSKLRAMAEKRFRGLE